MGVRRRDLRPLGGVVRQPRPGRRRHPQLPVAVGPRAGRAPVRRAGAEARAEPEHLLADDPDRQRGRFTGRYDHRVFGGIGHNVPQEAPEAFARAVVDADRLRRAPAAGRDVLADGGEGGLSEAAAGSSTTGTARPRGWSRRTSRVPSSQPVVDRVEVEPGRVERATRPLAMVLVLGMRGISTGAAGRSSRGCRRWCRRPARSTCVPCPAWCRRGAANP